MLSVETTGTVFPSKLPLLQPVPESNSADDARRTVALRASVNVALDLSAATEHQPSSPTL